MIDRWIGPDLLRTAFANTFKLDPSRIEVTDDTSKLTGRNLDRPYILLEHIPREGPFPLQLNVFLVGEAIEQPVAELAGTLMRARELARALGAVLLLGTGPIAHDEQIRIAPDGTVDIVELDGEELDEDRFVISGSRPFGRWTIEATPTSIKV